MKAHYLNVSPKLVMENSALVFWNAMTNIFSEAQHQYLLGTQQVLVLNYSSKAYNRN